MAKKAKDWTSEGCGLTWTISGDTAEWYRRTMILNGVAKPPPYKGQEAQGATGWYKIGGTERIALTHEHGTTLGEMEIGAYQSHAEARVAAAAFAYGDGSRSFATVLEDAGYVPSRHAGGRTTYAKTDGSHDASVVISWPRDASGDARATGLFVQSTIRGRGKVDLHTASIWLPREDSRQFERASPWTPAEILSLSVQAAVAVTEARLKARGGRSRAKPLGDGEEIPFIAPMLERAA